MAVLMVASLAGCSSGAKETETTAAASEAGAETAAESEGETAAGGRRGGEDCERRNPDYGTNATFPPYEYYVGRRDCRNRRRDCPGYRREAGHGGNG